MPPFTFVPMPAPSGLRAQLKADYFKNLHIPPEEGIQPVGLVIALGFAFRPAHAEQSKATWLTDSIDEDATAYLVLLDGSKFPNWYYFSELEGLMFA